MKKEIGSIFNNNKRLLDILDKCIIYFRKQNYDRALRMTTDAVQYLSTLIEALSLQIHYFNEKNDSFIDMNTILSMMSSVLDAQEIQDYILLADLMEVQLIPYINRIQEFIIGNEEFVFDEDTYVRQREILNAHIPEMKDVITSPLELLNEGYLVEYTSSGYMTVAVQNSGKSHYLHSNNHVRREAYTLADSWYSRVKTTYLVYGLGFAYHIYELLAIDENISIEVYESDENMLSLICAFAEVETLLNMENVNIVYDKDCSKFFQRISSMDEATEVVIHYPSLRHMKPGERKEKLENYFLQYNSVKNQMALLKGNFRENVKNYDGVVDELKERFIGKDLFIIAAGPSLDKNFIQLKNRKENSIILATGTVFRKLVQAGIQPDYVIVTDANTRVLGQIYEVEDNKAEMIFLSTAYKGFAKHYRSRKYIAFQKDFDMAEEYAGRKGYHLYQTGGSVSTTALDIGLQFQCARIIFLGLDLAYPNNFVHASNTSRRELVDTQGLKQVKDIHGSMIYTSNSLDSYRRWIEKRIRDVEQVELINATEGGAYIEGMKVRNLSEVI